MKYFLLIICAIVLISCSGRTVVMPTYPVKTAMQTPITFSSYDAEPARASESNIHGGLLSLASGQNLDSSPNNIVVTKGIGKLMIVINAGSDLTGTITVTGDSVDRNTGEVTIADTDTITVDSLTIDNSSVDGNGNMVHNFVGAYMSSKWFVDSVTLSTTDLNLTDVDVYHVSFEQFNDQPSITLDTFDINVLTTHQNAELDAYLYCLEIESGNKATIAVTQSLHIGTNGKAAIPDKYWRLRRGMINKQLDGTTDGVWVDIHYKNSPAYIEDMSMKVWAREFIVAE